MISNFLAPSNLVPIAENQPFAPSSCASLTEANVGMCSKTNHPRQAGSWLLKTTRNGVSKNQSHEITAKKNSGSQLKAYFNAQRIMTKKRKTLALMCSTRVLETRHPD